MACPMQKSQAVTPQDNVPEDRGRESPQWEHSTAVLPLQASYRATNDLTEASHPGCGNSCQSAGVASAGCSSDPARRVAVGGQHRAAFVHAIRHSWVLPN